MSLTISCGNPPSGRVGQPYSNFIFAIGGVQPYVFTVFNGTLPTGLVLDSATGEIHGTPTTVGIYVFTIKVKSS